MKSFLKAALGVAVLLLALLYVFVLGARLYGRAFTRSLRDVFRALLGFHAAQALNGNVIDLTHLHRREVEAKQRFWDRLLRRKTAEASFLKMLGGLLSATYNYKGGVVSGTAAGSASNPGGFGVGVIELDFVAIAAARVAAGQTAITTADVLQVFTVRAGTWVPAVFVRPTTAEGATMTIDVGDGTDGAGYINNGDINATTMLSSLITTTYSLATAGGKYYAAADTIDVIPNNASPATAVIELIVVTVDLRNYR